MDLEPATWYNLRITAHNSAGFTVAEYDFATLTVTGGIYTLFSNLLKSEKRKELLFRFVSEKARKLKQFLLCFLKKDIAFVHI